MSSKPAVKPKPKPQPKPRQHLPSSESLVGKSQGVNEQTVNHDLISTSNDAGPSARQGDIRHDIPHDIPHDSPHDIPRNNRRVSTGESLNVDSKGNVVSFDVREDEEQLEKLDQMIELLVAAGYFRARIKGLSSFDKVCISFHAVIYIH